MKLELGRNMSRASARVHTMSLSLNRWVLATLAAPSLTELDAFRNCIELEALHRHVDRHRPIRVAMLRIQHQGARHNTQFHHV